MVRLDGEETRAEAAGLSHASGRLASLPRDEQREGTQGSAIAAWMRTAPEGAVRSLARRSSLTRRGHRSGRFKCRSRLRTPTHQSGLDLDQQADDGLHRELCQYEHQQEASQVCHSCPASERALYGCPLCTLSMADKCDGPHFFNAVDWLRARPSLGARGLIMRTDPSLHTSPPATVRAARVPQVEVLGYTVILVGFRRFDCTHAPTGPCPGRASCSCFACS